MNDSEYTKVKDGRAFVLQSGHRGTAPFRKVTRQPQHKSTCPIKDWQPSAVSLQKATVYRISTLVQARNVATRMHQKVIKRRQKTSVSSVAETVTSTDKPTKSVTREEGIFFDPDNYNPDQEGDWDEVPAPVVARSPGQELYMKACRRLGVAPATSFYQFIDTTTINMFHHSIGPTGAEACCIALTSNTTVTSLNLGDNGVGDHGAHVIAQMLEENIGITDLTLSDNNIGSIGLTELTDAIVDIDRLTKLDLSGNGFNERDGSHIARIIRECEHLRELNISHNCFREEGGVTIAAALKDNDTLEKLDTSWNHLRRRGAIETCKILKVNLALTYISLAWNGLGLEGCKALGAVLPANPVLLTLDISSNRIDMAALNVLLKGVQKNSTLKSLKLASNPIGSEGAVSLLRAIVKNEESALEEVDISDQCVDQTFVDLQQALEENRGLIIHHGIVLSQDSLSKQTDDAFSKDEPMMVLMEFMRLENLRLLDLFASLDKDGSRSLTRSEFRNGLLSVNIPLSAASLDRLVNKLDADGDGEVDFGELLAGQKEHKRKLHRIKQRQRDVPFAETEIGILSMKIKAVLALRRGLKRSPEPPLKDKEKGVVRAFSAMLKSASGEMNTKSGSSRSQEGSQRISKN